MAALDLLAQVQGGDERALGTWVTAGILGAALGPAAGVLTQLLGWESIFLVQVPLALALLFAVRGVTGRPTRHAPAGRRSPPTSRCSSSLADSSRRCSSSCYSSSTGGG